MFAALGRSAYRRRKLIVVLWSLAFAAGLVASLSVASQLKGGGFTNPSSPSQQGQRQMQERLGLRPGEPHHRLQQRRARRRAARPSARRWRRLSRVSRDAGLDGLTGVRTARTTGDASFISRDGTATFAVLEFDGTSEQVQAQIPALRRALKPTRLDDLSDRRPRRLRGARAALRRGPAQGGELHDPRGHPRARAHLRDAGGRRPAGHRRRHGRDRHPGHLLAARPGPGHLRLRDERRDAARPGRRHRLRAVHGRAVPRGARRGARGGRGGRDDGRHRRPLHLLQRDHRRRRAARAR